MTKLAALGLATVLLGLGLGGIVYFFQRRVLFPAPRAAGLAAPAGVEVVRLTTPTGSVEALYLGPMVESGPAPLFIFAHGNAELADQWIEQFREAQSWGWGALLLEYPGYGRSEGTPSEESINAAIEAAWTWTQHDRRIDANRIVAYGRSLGGGPAVHLAAKHHVAGLILESAFTGVRPLAARLLIPGVWVRDPFDNLAGLVHYSGPLLVIHGTSDEVIPVAHGRALAGAVPGAMFRELDCGHNDCPRPWSLIREFLVGHGLIAGDGLPNRSGESGRAS